MDIVTIVSLVGGVTAFIGAIASIIASVQKIGRDTKSITDNIDHKYDSLSKEHASLSKEHTSLSKEHDSIKKDTEYISNEMRYEKMAREKLYENSSRAKEILETMDMMKEVVLQNAKLNEENAILKVQNQELTQTKNNSGGKKLLNVIDRFDRKLSEFEEYRDTEEIQRILAKIRNELSEYDR
ncbi:hypothetical protein K6V78_03695 [Streptococcus gallolyticus]|nr:hypothetical protein [Streptococcus gallolyticus]MBY5040677.1 hypothetical protein [Streptococcus gallolyticus]